MELLWMIAVTLAALGFAWYIGGKLDVHTARKQKEEESLARQEWIEELSLLAVHSAQALWHKDLIEYGQIHNAAFIFAQVLAEHSGEELKADEWDRISAYMFISEADDE